MKITGFIVLFFLWGQVAFGQKTHIGKWKGQDYTGKDVTFVFTKDGWITLNQGGKEIGGQKFLVEGTQSYASMKYEINYEQSPVYLDLLILDFDSQKELGRLVNIVEIINKKTLKIQLSENQQRPESFQEDGKTWAIVKKIK